MSAVFQGENSTGESTLAQLGVKSTDALLLGTGGSVPTGCIALWLAALANVPTGWLLADGTAVSRTTYSALFTLLGTTYGVGNGTTTFNLPDARGQYHKGWAAGVDPGGTGGALTHTHASHSHTPAGSVAAPVFTGTPKAVAGTVGAIAATGTAALAGSGVGAVPLADQIHTHPAPTFTGSSYTPDGTNSAPAFTGNAATLAHDSPNHEPPFMRVAVIIKT